MTMSKPQWPQDHALRTADLLASSLNPFCERIGIAGSIRRGKNFVSDIELLYVPRYEDRALDLLSTAPVSLADEQIDLWLRSGTIAKRPSKTGVFSWGEKNKLAVHVPSGIPVDFFAVLPNRCVCGTVTNESKGNTSKPGSVQEELRCLPEILRRQECEGVQQEMQHRAPMERGEGAETREQLPDNDLPCVPKEVREQKLLERQEVVFTGMRKDSSRPGDAETDGLEKTDKLLPHPETRTGLHHGVFTGEMGGGGQEAICPATPIGDGKTSWQEITSSGIGSPSEWSKGRQPTSQFADRSEKNPHGGSCLPPLSKVVSDKVTCLACSGWFVALVIRTGSKETNLRLTTGAQRRGGSLEAYGCGVRWSDGTVKPCLSEQDVFEQCGVPYLEPNERTF